MQHQFEVVLLTVSAKGRDQVRGIIAGATNNGCLIQVVARVRTQGGDASEGVHRPFDGPSPLFAVAQPVLQQQAEVSLRDAHWGAHLVKQQVQNMLELGGGM